MCDVDDKRISELILELYDLWKNFTSTSDEIRRIMELPNHSDIVDNVAAVFMSSGARSCNKERLEEMRNLVEYLDNVMGVLDENRRQPIPDFPGMILSVTECLEQLKKIFKKTKT